MRLSMPAWRSAPPETGELQHAHLRYSDLAIIGMFLAIAAGFVCQGVIWLAM